MKTKILLYVVAILAAGVTISMAQVYSSNVVGYIVVTVTNNGYSALCTQMDADGTGTNDTVAWVFSTNLPPGSIVETWNGSSYILNTFNSKTKVWFNSNQLINPGMGYFVYNPCNYVVNLPLAGNVLQGHLTNSFFGKTGNYGFVGSMIPISGGITTVLPGYQPSPNDKVETWNQTVGSFNLCTYNSKTKAWTPSEPQIAIAESFFIVTTNLNQIIQTNYTVQ